jgi:hypothetical protein
MSGNTNGSADDMPETPGRNRKWLIALVALALAVVLGIVLVGVNRPGTDPAVEAATDTTATGAPAGDTASPTDQAAATDDASDPASDPASDGATDEAPDPAADAAATSEPPADTPATAPPTEASNLHLATVDQPVKDPVDLNGTADLGNGITAAVKDLQAVQGEAQGIGEIAGPALKFTLTVSNGTDQAVSLTDAVVNVTYGPEDTPASPLSGPGPVAFPASVDAKGSAAGTFIFAIPAESRDNVKILLNYSVAAPIAAFTGPVPKP